MVSESIITHRRDDCCHVIYSYLDLKGGPQRRPQRGFDYIARQLGYQARTVAEHARHLAEDRLIVLQEPPGKGAATMWIAHNPGRDWVVEDVSLNTRTERSRSKSKWTRDVGPKQQAPCEGDEKDRSQAATSPAAEHSATGTTRVRRGSGDAPATRVRRGSDDAPDAPRRSAWDAPRLRSPRSEVGLESNREAEEPAGDGDREFVAGLPVAYDSDEALDRLRSRVGQAQFLRPAAEAAAKHALAEAPFTAPTPEGWRLVEARAVELAQNNGTTDAHEDAQPQPGAQVPRLASWGQAVTSTTCALCTARPAVLTAYWGPRLCSPCAQHLAQRLDEEDTWPPNPWESDEVTLLDLSGSG